MSKRKYVGLLLMVAICVSLLSGLVIKAEARAAEDGLVVHLKFDGDLTDASGNGNDAICEYGKITYADGIHGQSAVFNGKTYIEIPDSDSLDLKTLTISLWAYKLTPMKNFDSVPFVYKEKDEENWSIPYRLFENGYNEPVIILDDGGADFGQFQMFASPIDLREWFLLTVTFNGKEARIYKNGELLRKQNVSVSPMTTLGDLYIGLDENGDIYFKGNMDDLRIYNRALSAKEVADLYEAGLKERPDLLTQKNAMVAYYKFNGDYKDSSEYGNDADLAAGKITFVDGVNGKAAQFKKGTYLEVADNTSIDFDEGFSITGWIKLTDDKDTAAIFNRPGVTTSGNSDDIDYRLRLGSDYIDFDYTPFDELTSYLTYRYSIDSNVKNKWFHIGLTFDTNEIRWYYNGKMVKKEEISSFNGYNMAHAFGDLMIGSDGKYFFIGVMDELKFYNYALSAKEVQEDYKKIDSISISKDNQDKIKSMKKGSTLALVTSRTYVETGKTSKVTSGLTYSSSNKKVFTVSSKGEIKAIGKGTATLTVTHGGISKTYKVTVK